MKYCLVWAYSVRSSQVSGPAWINDTHHSIHAKTAAPVEIGEVKRMLQSLLTARFRLVLRRDTRERPALGIVAARTLRVVARNTGFDFLEQILSLPVWDPVVNLTGLNGEYDFTFERPPFRGQPDDIRAELSAALQRQLGLQLVQRRAPLEMIVVEKGDPNPIEN